MQLKKIILTFILSITISNSKELEKVSLQLDWLHQFQFAGYYIAKEKGFYSDVNLDVEFKEFEFSSDLVEDVLSSKTHYATGKSSLIIDALEDKPILLLSAIYQNSPMVLISLKKPGTRKNSTFENKKIMLTSDAKNAANIKSMLISQGANLDKINFIPHSFNLEDLITNKTDAMAAYISNEPFLLKQSNIDFEIHNPSSYGFDFYDGLLFTSKEELINNPKRVKNFQSASLKGWKYAFENIEETAKIIFDKYNTQNKTLESLIFEGQKLKELSKIDEGVLGQIDHDKIKEIKRLYLVLGIAKNNKNLKIHDLVYNSQKIYLSSKEKQYLENNKITLLTNSNFPPFTMIKDDKLSGIEIDFWNLINQKLNLLEVHTKVIDKNELALNLLKNNPNSIKYSFSKNDNKKFLKKTNDLDELSLGIATLINKPFINNISELNNKKIAIVKYSSFSKDLKQKYPKIDFIETKNLDESLKLLKKRKVFGIINKLSLLSYYITTNSLTDIKISGTLEQKISLNLLVNEENLSLLNILNKAISTITDLERYEINKKYYPILYKSSFDYSLLYKIIIPLVIIIFIVIILNLRLAKEISKRKEIEKKLNKLANIDSLTNIYTRRKIEVLYEKEITRAKRYNRELSVIFFDIDNFKDINDTLGHATGDTVLIELASVVKDNIRNEDFFGRWGGEEFLIVLPETNKEKATRVAHVLKNKINSHDFDIKRVVTCSFGVSQFLENDTSDSLLIRADNALYHIKTNGKNEVKTA